jgi:hypothetical protein
MGGFGARREKETRLGIVPGHRTVRYYQGTEGVKRSSEGMATPSAYRVEGGTTANHKEWEISIVRSPDGR